VVWLTSAILGLAYIAKTFAFVFLAVKYAGATYLLYIAWKMWTAPSALPEAGESVPKATRPLRLFAAGLSLALGNPKTMVFYLALLPNLIDLAHVTALGYAELVVITLTVLCAVFGGYTLLAARARRLIVSPRSLRLVNRGSSAVMAGAAVAIAAR
jgi:threonine/homoserine/homoserine lactone efflux protein